MFWDHAYATRFPDIEFLPAALLVTRVISRPAANRLCLDLGYKAVSPDNPDPRVHLLDLPDAKTVVHSEEHLAIESSRAASSPWVTFCMAYRGTFVRRWRCTRRRW